MGARATVGDGCARGEEDAPSGGGIFTSKPSALNDIELEEHHDGWKAVDKAAKKAVKKRRQSSAEIDADIVIGA